MSEFDSMQRAEPRLIRRKPFQDLTGFRFGRLLVIDRADEQNWNCLCDCGGKVVVFGRNLRKGQRKSCGCLRVEQARKANVAIRCRGGRPADELAALESYDAMMSRCTNPNHHAWARYGGRGITVCQRWMDSVAAFLEDMGPRPVGRLTIERIKNDGNYEPGNCRWATRKEQNRNKRSNVMLTYRGETLCISAWAERYGLRRNTLRQRILLGWSAEKALTTPPRNP